MYTTRVLRWKSLYKSTLFRIELDERRGKGDGGDNENARTMFILEKFKTHRWHWKQFSERNLIMTVCSRRIRVRHTFFKIISPLNFRVCACVGNEVEESVPKPKTSFRVHEFRPRMSSHSDPRFINHRHVPSPGQRFGNERPEKKNSTAEPPLYYSDGF